MTINSAYLKELEYVVANIVVYELWVQTSKVCIIDVLEDQTRRFALHYP